MVEMTNDKSCVDDNDDAINWKDETNERRTEQRDMAWNEIYLKWMGTQGYMKPKRSKKKIETFGEVVVFAAPQPYTHTLHKVCKLKRWFYS